MIFEIKIIKMNYSNNRSENLIFFHKKLYVYDCTLNLLHTNVTLRSILRKDVVRLERCLTPITLISTSKCFPPAQYAFLRYDVTLYCRAFKIGGILNALVHIARCTLDDRFLLLTGALTATGSILR